MFLKSRNKTWMSASTRPYPTYLFVVFRFQYYSFKRTFFFCLLTSLLHQHTFFTPKFSKDFYFSFFLVLNNGDEFTRKRKKQRAYLIGRKFFSPERLCVFLPRGSVHHVRVYTQQTERKWSGFSQQLSSASERLMW